MYLFQPLVVFLIVCACSTNGRRVGVRVRPAAQEELAAQPQEEVEFYADEQEPQQQVLIRQPPSIGRSIASQPRLQAIPARQKNQEDTKPAPVQTIRNYNKLNDDGSFTFGYESADGSFKEETRGTDCVVRGKYGYIDPDGNKREFTYVSGNPCDPNADKQEQEEELAEAPGAEENIPQNPQRPLKASRRPAPAPVSRPTTTLFQQQFNTLEDEEEPQVNIQPRPTPRPTQFITPQQEIQPQIFRGSAPPPRPTFAPSPSRPNVRFQQPAFEQPPATTFRPQIQVSSSPASPTIRTQTQSPSPKPSIDFSSEFKKFQLDFNDLSPSRGPGASPSPSPSSQPSGSPLYQTELVFDPQTGQYNTVVYQQVPRTAESPITQRSPFIASQPAPQFFSPPRQSFSQPPPSAFQQQQLFQQQQSALQVQQSQQLFEQQQQAKQEPTQRIPNSLLRQSPQTFTSSQPAPTPSSPRVAPEQQQRFLSDAPSQRFSPSTSSQRFPQDSRSQRFSSQSPPQAPAVQPFFFVAQPSERQAFASGQIDTFLRGHNLQF